jgi:DtxR family Mn-dependent transcriptional regulator
MLSVGEVAEVTRFADKPEAVYAQLLAAGVYVGMKLQIVESTPLRIRFVADGDERVLAPLMAAHVAVKKVEQVESRERLSSLAVGESGWVRGISPSVRGVERRRLLDLGFVPGTEVRAELESASGDPMAYSIRGAVIALRERQARQIEIDKGTGS